MGYLFLLLAARCYVSAGTSHDLVSVSASVCHKLGVLSNESSRFLCMYVWILHCVLRTFEYLKIRVLISGTLPKTPDWRKFRHHVERCALLGLDRLELRRLRADVILCYKIIRGLVLLSPGSFFHVCLQFKNTWSFI